jgi:deoxyribonuclease-2
MSKIAFIAIFGLLAAAISTAEAQCVDEKGVQVDWLVLYKLPRRSEQFTKKDTGDIIEDGQGYMYFTSKTATSGWTLSKLSVKDVSSIPGRILSPIYGQKTNENLFHMFYNDEHPDGNTSFSMGHTKGALVFNDQLGYWLVHSVPKYPPAMTEDQQYDYPHTGQMYGQSFLCISLHTKTSADLIGIQLLYNHPFVYSVNIPKWAERSYPYLTRAAQGEHVKKAPFFHTMTFRSLNGLRFTSFAKYTHFGQDLYADLVAPTLRTNLMVETWPNGPGKMNSSCQGVFKVLNIDAIDFKSKPRDVSFVTKKDHAKWAVSYIKPNLLGGLSKDKYVCIGDINRMETQKKRAGGTVCFQDKFAWKAFTTIIKAIEPCHK